MTTMTEVLIRDRFNDAPDIDIDEHFPEIQPGSLSWERSGTWLIVPTGDELGHRASTTHAIATFQVGQKKVRIESTMLATRGTTTGQWTGITLLGTSASINDCLIVRFFGTTGAPTLELSDGTSSVKASFPMTGIIDPPSNGSLVRLAAEFDPATSLIQVEIDTDPLSVGAGSAWQTHASWVYDVSTELALSHGASAPTATWFGLYDNSRNSTSRFLDFFVLQEPTGGGGGTPIPGITGVELGDGTLMSVELDGSNITMEIS